MSFVHLLVSFCILLVNSGHLLVNSALLLVSSAFYSRIRGIYSRAHISHHRKKKKRHNGTSFLKLRQYGCAHQVAVHFSCHFSAFIDCPNDEALPSSCISGSENPFDIRSVFAIDGINFLIDCFYAKLS